jgi:hypothetical protein
MSRNISTKVLNKIKKYWPDQDPERIIKILQGYGQEKYEEDSPRIQLAIIKLSDGDLDKLEEYVNLAKRDYRDVLAFAEYPEEIRTGFVGMEKLSEEEAKALRGRDREQYLSWLED